MLRPQAIAPSRSVVPLTTLPSCRRPAAARAAPLARPTASAMSTTTRTNRSRPLLSSAGPSKGGLLAARASSDRAIETNVSFSVLEPLSYSQAMGGSAGFRVGEGGSTTTTTTTLTTKKDNEAESIKSRVARFAARFVCVALVVVMALSAAAPSALAARSGGRMGGSAFGGGMAASHSFSSSSYSSSSSSFRGGSGRFGGGSVLGRTAAAAPLARGGPLYSSAPSRLNSLTLGWGLVPFGGFGYGGYPAYGGGGGGGGGLSDLLFFGLFALIAVSAISQFTRARSDGDSSDGADDDGQAYDEGVTVAKLQVGLLSSARGLKRDLERIAAKADTSTPSGLHYVLQETVLSLLRNPEYAVYGAASTLRGRSLARAERKFNELSLAERGKVREETLVNVSGIRREGGFKGKGKGDEATAGGAGDEELIVVTVLVASKGRFKLPAVRSGAELRQALSALGAVPSDGVLGVEVLWTPQDPQDSYSKGELMVDFPDLNNL